MARFGEVTDLNVSARRRTKSYGTARRAPHVLHVIDRLGVGGMERMLVDLCHQAAADGWKVSVCVTRNGGPLASEIARSIEVVELGRNRRWEVKPLLSFGRFIRTRGIDLLHVHGRSSLSFVSLAKALGLVRVPVLFHDHFGSIEVDRGVPTWFRVAGRLFVDLYVGVYDALGAWARRAGVSPRKIEIIGNAVNLRRVTSVAGEAGSTAPLHSGREVVGLTIAGIRTEKGTDVLLRAVARLPRDIDLVVLIVGGDANPVFAKECRALCAELGIEDRIRFLGERRDVPALLAGADFAVMPSRSESGPLVLIEYMALGLPFVATRVGDVSKRAEQLGLTEFVNPDDPAAMAQALERLIRLSAAERRERGARGRRIAEQHFDIRKVAPQWYALYDQILAR